MGVFGIGSIIYLSIYDPEIASLTFLNKFLFVSVGIYISVVFLLMPTFMRKQLITYDYYNASDYKKAKTNLFMFKVTSPFWAYIFIASYIVIGLDFKMILLGGIFLYYIISGSYTIKKEEKL